MNNGKVVPVNPRPIPAGGQGIASQDLVPRDVLVQAVEIIRAWHGMKQRNAKLERESWEIYWRNAPEMRPIREALER